MTITVAGGVGGSTIAAPTMSTLTAELRPSALSGSTSLVERVLRVIGRAFLGFPASTWLMVDVLLIGASVYLAYQIVPPLEGTRTPHVALWQASAIYAFSVILASLVFGLYERETVMGRSRILIRMLLTSCAATILAYAVIYVVMYATVSRRASAVAMSTFFTAGVGVRIAAWWLIQRIHCGLLVVGPRALYDSFVRAQSNGFLHEYRLVGFASTVTEPSSDVGHSKSLGPVQSQVGNLSKLGVTDLVVSDNAARDPNVMQWMVPCLQHGCRVTNQATFYEKATGQILVDEITPAWFLFADLKVHCDEQATIKRLMDLVISGLGLILSAPLWPLIALAIKISDRGPVLYSQDRVGQNGRLFRLYKFRSMRIDAENGVSVWCSPNDPRVTRVGRFLRKTRLDELPQLYNVLIGQMSIVGPRPERPDFVENLKRDIPFYGERHLVKPGITGWAQISFRYGASVEDAKRKLQFDLYYLKHMSFELDVIILFRTAGTFLRGGC